MAKRRRERKSRIKQRERRQQLIIFGSLGAVLVVFLGVIAYNILTAPPDVSQDRLEQEAVMGTPNARVQIIEYGAYGCSHCKDLHDSGAIERMVDTYGDVQFMFRNLPIITSNDRRGAEVAQCALDQGDQAFWDMHDAIFSLATSEFTNASESDFIGLAREAGLDADALKLCLDDHTHERTVDYWENAGRRLGINTTPTLYVNGQPLPDPSLLEDAVNAALSSQG